MGASQDEESFVLMRSIFQALETALGPQHLVVHHVTSHTGDCFNEFVDTVAKLEARQTMNMQRQKIDMSKWSVHFRQLWVAFDSQYGMPTWTDGSWQCLRQTSQRLMIPALRPLVAKVAAGISNLC